MGGHIPIGLPAYIAAMTQIKAGNLKVLATLAGKKFEMLPQVPMVVELGCHPCYTMTLGLFVPKGTPDTIVKKMRETAKKAMGAAAYREKCNNLAFQAAFEDGEQYKSALERDKVSVGDCLRRWGYVKK